MKELRKKKEKREEGKKERDLIEKREGEISRETKSYW